MPLLFVVVVILDSFAGKEKRELALIRNAREVFQYYESYFEIKIGTAGIETLALRVIKSQKFK